MLKLLRILILLAISFNLGAETTPKNFQVDTIPVEQTIGKLRSNYENLNQDIASLKNQVSASLDSNNNVVKESRALFDQVNKLIQVQKAQRKDILDVMEQAKEIKESKADLSLSIASDKLAIFWNVIAAILIAFGSVYITFKVLTKTLANETDKQVSALENSLLKTKQLNQAQIAAQIEIANRQNSVIKDDLAAKIKISNEQLKVQIDIAKTQNERFSEELQAKMVISNKQLNTQLKSVSEHTKEAHLLKLDEFRQIWINTFREDVSILFKYFIEIKGFYLFEPDFLISLHIYESDIKEYNNSMKDLVISLDEASENERGTIQGQLNDTADKLRQRKTIFEEHADKRKEFNLLQTEMFKQKTKILLMFNPNGTKLEMKIVKKIEYIDLLLSLKSYNLEQAKNMIKVDVALGELQSLVKVMFKTEWNRIRRNNIKANR